MPLPSLRPTNGVAVAEVVVGRRNLLRSRGEGGACGGVRRCGGEGCGSVRGGGGRGGRVGDDRSGRFAAGVVVRVLSGTREELGATGGVGGGGGGGDGE